MNGKSELPTEKDHVFFLPVLFFFVKTALFPSILLLEVFLAFPFIPSCQYTRNIISYPFELKTRKRSKDEYRTISFPQKTKNGRTVTTLMWGSCSARSVILDFMNPLKPDVRKKKYYVFEIHFLPRQSTQCVLKKNTVL